MKLGRKSTDSCSGNQKVYSSVFLELVAGAVAQGHARTRIEAPLAAVGEFRLGKCEVVQRRGLEAVAAKHPEIDLDEIVVIVEQGRPMLIADFTVEMGTEEAAADTDGLRLRHCGQGQAEEGDHNQKRLFHPRNDI